MCSCAKLFSIFLFLSLCLCYIDSRRIKRVVGGQKVTCGTHPRVASLRNATTDQHLCVATIISAEFALTAAHCVDSDSDQYVLYLNNYCPQHGNTRIAVTEIIVNDLYDKYSRAHDIALVRISHELQDAAWLNHTVIPQSVLGLSGQCEVFGYGYQHAEVKEHSETLLTGVMSIMSLDECFERLGPYVAPGPGDGMLCAMGAGVDACQGDSGGPLMCKGLVQALSSYGMSCGVPGLPGVFTSVGPHLKWINEIVNTYYEFLFRYCPDNINMTIKMTLKLT